MILRVFSSSYIVSFIIYAFWNVENVKRVNYSYEYLYRLSSYDFGLRVNLQNGYLKNSDLSARFSQLENHQPDTVEFLAGDSLISMAIHSLKITHNVSLSDNISSIILFCTYILFCLKLCFPLDGIT